MFWTKKKKTYKSLLVTTKKEQNNEFSFYTSEYDSIISLYGVNSKIDFAVYNWNLETFDKTVKLNFQIKYKKDTDLVRDFYDKEPGFSVAKFSSSELNPSDYSVTYNGTVSHNKEEKK